MDTLRSPIDAVVDELAIRDLVQRYADATSRLDAGGVADCFAADGEWRAEGIGHPRGRAEMVPLFTRLLEGWTGFLHVLPSGRVRLDPDDRDRASGRWYVMEMGQRTDGADLSVWGVYHDVYVRDGGSWRIALRRFDRLFMRRGEGLAAWPFPANVPDFA